MNDDRINEHYHGDPTSPVTQRARQRIHWICAQARGRDVLDLGCSQGIVCQILGREGFHCTGIDIEAAAVEAARAARAAESEIVRDRTRFQVGDASPLPYGDASFDTVVLGEVLERLLHPGRVLEEARRVLRPGGRLVVTVPHGLQAHADPKRTYYAGTLRELLEPLFPMPAIDILPGFLTAIATQEPPGGTATISVPALVDDLRRLQRFTEERCLQTELRLLEAQRELLQRDKASHDASTPAGTEDARAKNRKFQSFAVASTPPGARVLVVNKGDADLLDLRGREGCHFPQAPGGAPAGHHPADSDAAIAHLEGLREAGAGFLLVPEPYFWWLEFYAGFREHLTRHHRVVAYREGVGILFRLAPNGPPPDVQIRLECHSPSTAGEAQKADTRPSIGAAPAGPADALRPAEPMIPRAPAHPDGRLKVAAILDTFSQECVKPECHMTTFGPEDWQQVLEADRPEALFVESTWRGNDGAWWPGRGKSQARMDQALRRLVGWSRERGIPTLYWNKEDPVHFDRFIEQASSFDCVFTSDAGSIPAYRERLRHDRVFALPFAAQPRMHHPIASAPRTGAVCFAGSYRPQQHEQRRKDMEFILAPAIDFGLDIYDRNLGRPDIAPGALQFPAPYQPCIRGRLEYGDMSEAYRRYRVFLNVNTVKESTTMFARRVFELLACGTPVISNYSRGIVELLGEDVVFLSESADDTRRHLGRLLGDPDAWARASVRGIRKVLEAHTYAHRWDYVLRQAGIPSTAPRLPQFDVLAKVMSSEEAEAVGALVARQVHRPARILLVSDRPLEARILESAGHRSGGLPVLQVALSEEASGQRELHGGDAAAGSHVCLFRPGDHYGPNYLKDQALAFTWSGAQIVGKHDPFMTTPGGQAVIRPGAPAGFRWVDAVPSGSLAWRKGAIPVARVRECLQKPTLQWETRTVLSIDAFNYVLRRPEPEGGSIASWTEALLREVEV